MLHIIDVSAALPGEVGRVGWVVRAAGDIRSVVVHIDGVPLPWAGMVAYDPLERYAAQAREHMRRNWNAGVGPRVRGFGLMWHYRVSADGRVWRTQPEEVITWHAAYHNRQAIAVCCDLGREQAPTEAQLRGLGGLLDWLCRERTDIPATHGDVWGHRECTLLASDKLCPGNLLPWVQSYRFGG